MTVAIVDVNDKAFKKNKLFEVSKETESRILPLNEYLQIAKRTIGKFATPSLANQMLNSEDAIAFVAEHLMKATLRWKEDGGRTLYAYLNQCAIWAIQRYVLNMKAAKKYTGISLDMEISDDGDTMYNVVENHHASKYSPNNFDEMIEKDYLNADQKTCLRLRFVDNMTLRAIGEELGLTGARIEQIINAALSKLRKDDEYSETSQV